MRKIIIEIIPMPKTIKPGIYNLNINNKTLTIVIAKVAITAMFLYKGDLVKGIVFLILFKPILYSLNP